MAKLALRPYAPGDMDRFTPRADFAAERDAVAWNWPAGPPSPHTWTLCDGETVRGVAGLYGADWGRWEAWAVLGDLTPREWAQAAALAVSTCNAFQKARGERISASARTNLPGARRLLERIGFRLRATAMDPRLGGVAYHLMERAA